MQGEIFVSRAPKSTPLIDLINIGRVHLVREAIRVAPAEIDDVDAAGRTALMYAIADGNSEIALLLIEAGAGLNICDREGATALHFAAREKNKEIAQELIRMGAEIDARDAYGNTPLSNAVFASCGENGIIRILLEAGADKDIQNKCGISPWELAQSIANYDVVQFFRL